MNYGLLAEIAWKSVLIASAALIAAALLRSRSAADRSAVLKLGVLLLLMLPPITLLPPSLTIETPSPALPTETHDFEAKSASTAQLIQAERTLPMPAVAVEDPEWSVANILFRLYLLGLTVLSGRLGAGLWTLRRWTRNAQPVTCPTWQRALTRLDRQTGRTRLLVSDEASSPLSWGWRHPAILIDRDTLNQPEQADVILAHELAHVVRRDWLALIASRLALAVFWFNPLVWHLDREMAHHAEEAADGEATRQVEPAWYAQTLLDWARDKSRGALPANAIAAGEPGLSRRLRAILDGRIARRSGSSWTLVAMAGCVAFAAPVAAIDFVAEAPKRPLIVFTAVKSPVSLAAWTVEATGVPGSLISSAKKETAPLVELKSDALVLTSVKTSALTLQPNALVDVPQRKSEVRGLSEGGPTPEVSPVSIWIEQQVASAIRAGREQGAEGLMLGAGEMQRAANQMNEEARHLRTSREYREQQIAKAANRGEQLNHEALIKAADNLDEAAIGVRDGARDLREASAKMRRGE